MLTLFDNLVWSVPTRGWRRRWHCQHWNPGFQLLWWLKDIEDSKLSELSYHAQCYDVHLQSVCVTHTIFVETLNCVIGFYFHQSNCLPNFHEIQDIVVMIAIWYDYRWCTKCQARVCVHDTLATLLGHESADLRNTSIICRAVSPCGDSIMSLRISVRW